MDKMLDKSAIQDTPASEGGWVDHAEAAMERESAHLKRILGSKALAKSAMDEFDYALKLRSGEVIRFEKLEVVNDEWVTLCGVRFDESPRIAIGLPFPALRGIDVRISEIIWVMDAPNGS